MGRNEPEFDGAGEKLVFESAVGLGLLGLLIFVLGILQLFYLPVFLLLLLALAAVSWRALSEVISDALRGLQSLRRIEWRPENILVAAILSIIGILILIRTLTPPAGDDWDSLAYHLAVPKLFLSHHGIYHINFTSHSNFPFTWEMLYALGLAFGSISLAKLFHFGAGAILIVAVYCLGRRHFSIGTAGLAALILAGVPLFAWEATTAYIDLATALYSLMVIYALLNYSDIKDNRWAALAGITAGLAAGTKMTALLMIPIAAVWIIWVGITDSYNKKAINSAFRIPRSTFKTSIVVVGLALIIACPWYIKNTLYTGNPVYPFAYGIFGGRDWSQATAEIYRADQLKFGVGRDRESALLLPWNLTFRFTRFNDYGARLPEGMELPLFSGSIQEYLSSIGPMLLVVLPVLIIAILKKGKHRPLLVVSFTLTVVWFFTMQNTRYMLPVLAVLAPAAAYSAEVLRARKAIFTAAAVVGMFTVFLMAQFTWSAIPVAIGLQKPDTYLSSQFDVYRASKFANQHLPSDAKIAMFGETRGFYLDRDYTWADAGHNALIPYQHIGRDPNKLLDWLNSHGFDYLLINHANIPNGSPINNAVTEGLIERVYPGYGEHSSRIAIYRITYWFR